MMKKVIYSLTFLVMQLFNMSAQTNDTSFIQLTNATGYEFTSEEKDSMEIVASDLLSIFPDTLGFRDFKVFNYGNYIHNIDMNNDINYFTNKMKHEVYGMSRYYLLFYDFIDDEGKISYNIEFKFPEMIFLSCTSQASWKLLELEYVKILNDLGNKGKLEVLKKLKLLFLEKMTCCDGYNRSGCDITIELPKIKDLLLAKGFRPIPIKYLSQEPAIRSNGGSSRSGNAEGEKNIVVQLNGVDTELDLKLNEGLNTIESEGLTAKGFITINSNLNGVGEFFDEIDNSYESSSEFVKVWWHVWDDPSSDEDILFEKITNIDYLYNVMLEKEIKSEFDDIVTPPGLNCSGTKRAYAIPEFLVESDHRCYTRSKGILAHTYIYTHYMNVNKNDNIEFEYAIPKTSKGNPMNTGFADIVNFTQKEIFEIKSVCSVQDGIIEVGDYVKKFNEECLEEDTPINEYFKKGKKFSKTIIPTPWPKAGRQLIAHLDNRASDGGVITYEIIGRIKDKDPIEVPLIIYNQIKNTLENMSNDLGNAKQIALEAINRHPENIAAFLAAGATLAVGGTVIATASSSTGIGAVIAVVGVDIAYVGAILASAVVYHYIYNYQYGY